MRAGSAARVIALPAPIPAYCEERRERGEVRKTSSQ